MIVGWAIVKPEGLAPAALRRGWETDRFSKWIPFEGYKTSSKQTEAERPIIYHDSSVAMAVAEKVGGRAVPVTINP